MDNNPKKSQRSASKGKMRKLSKLEWGLIFVAGVLLLVLAAMLILKPYYALPEVPTPTAPSTQATTTAPETTETLPPETTVETEPVMLAEMAELYAQNPEIVGWLKIEGTKIDYPLMYTPEDPEKYIRLNFEGKRNAYGLPFVDGHCSMDPESQNLVIYGHNMNNGTMFGQLMEYEKEKFWKDHPIIELTTLYEKRQYEVVAAFRDRVYHSYEDVFKFYQLIDILTEEELEEAMTYYKEKSFYDTGVEIEMDDRIMTLVTCAYHTKYGRFVVVAREITENET